MQKNLADGLEQAYSLNNEIRILDENLPEPAASFDVQEFSDQGIIFDEDGVVVTAFPVNHGELIKPAVGYRIDYAGVSVVISGDTTYDERLAEIARGTDLLIHEVLAFGDDVLQQVPTAEQIAAHHTTPEEAGQIFRLASPKLAAYTHLVTRGVTIEEIITRTRTQYDGPLISGEDMMSFSITRDGVQVNPQ